MADHPIIDYSDTAPPPEGYLRCCVCGRTKPYLADRSYNAQENCGGCGASGQTMMGFGWAGWKTTTEDREGR